MHLVEGGNGQLYDFFDNVSQADNKCCSISQGYERKTCLYKCIEICVNCYNCHFSYDSKPIKVNGCSVELLLINLVLFLRTLCFVFRPKAKKGKLEKSAPLIAPSPAINNSASIIQSFEMAVKCFELLNSTEELKYGSVSEHFALLYYRIPLK